jgi:hypothetical protein
MKGVIFNLLEEVITGESGEEAWDTLLEETQLDGVYTSLGSYPDAELRKLVLAASSLRKQPPDAVLRFFGAKAIPLLAAKYPTLFAGHAGTRSFLLTLNDIIHPEVRKLYPGADVPDFTYDTTSEDVLTMIYSSPRKLCELAEGLIHGAAAYYGEEATITQSECMHRGASRCVLSISFRSREPRTNG